MENNKIAKKQKIVTDLYNEKQELDEKIQNFEDFIINPLKFIKEYKDKLKNLYDKLKALGCECPKCKKEFQK